MSENDMKKDINARQQLRIKAEGNFKNLIVQYKKDQELIYEWKHHNIGQKYDFMLG